VLFTIELPPPHTLQSMKFGLFLLSICHVVIVVQDSPYDLSLWRYVRDLELLKYQIQDPGTAQVTKTVPHPLPNDPSNALLFGDKRIEFLPEMGWSRPFLLFTQI